MENERFSHDGGGARGEHVPTQGDMAALHVKNARTGILDCVDLIEKLRNDKSELESGNDISEDVKKKVKRRQAVSIGPILNKIREVENELLFAEEVAKDADNIASEQRLSEIHALREQIQSIRERMLQDNKDYFAEKQMALARRRLDDAKEIIEGRERKSVRGFYNLDNNPWYDAAKKRIALAKKELDRCEYLGVSVEDLRNEVEKLESRIMVEKNTEDRKREK